MAPIPSRITRSTHFISTGTRFIHTSLVGCWSLRVICTGSLWQNSDTRVDIVFCMMILLLRFICIHNDIMVHNHRNIYTCLYTYIYKYNTVHPDSWDLNNISTIQKHRPHCERWLTMEQFAILNGVMVWWILLFEAEVSSFWWYFDNAQKNFYIVWDSG